MARLTLLLASALALAGAFVSRAPVKFGSQAAAVSRPAPALRGAAVTPLAAQRSRFARMGLGEAAPVEPTTESACIEDEAVEECTLAEWPAGAIKVRRPPALHPPDSRAD
jgi:hypothetical protein